VTACFKDIVFSDKLVRVILGGAKKTSRTFACIIRPSGQSESTRKHLCNDQTSTNMCRNFCL